MYQSNFWTTNIATISPLLKAIQGMELSTWKLTETSYDEHKQHKTDVVQNFNLINHKIATLRHRVHEWICSSASVDEFEVEQSVVRDSYYICENIHADLIKLTGIEKEDNQYWLLAEKVLRNTTLLRSRIEPSFMRNIEMYLTGIDQCSYDIPVNSTTELLPMSVKLLETTTNGRA